MANEVKAKDIVLPDVPAQNSDWQTWLRFAVTVALILTSTVGAWFAANKPAPVVNVQPAPVQVIQTK